MFDINIKQGCPVSLTLFGLYIDELEKHMDVMDENSPCVI